MRAIQDSVQIHSRIKQLKFFISILQELKIYYQHFYFFIDLSVEGIVNSLEF